MDELVSPPPPRPTLLRKTGSQVITVSDSQEIVPQPGARHGVLAVDAGPTGIELCGTCNGQVVHGRRAGLIAQRPLMPQIAAAITSFLNQTGMPIHAVGVGASGDERPNAAELLPLLSPAIVQAAVAHDSTTWYLGAIGDEPGVVIAVGTGVVALAMGENAVARVDGWGHVMGDAGSAYWIGRNALEAAMRGYDGRRQMTALTDVVAADFPNIETAYLELQADPYRVTRIAAYATKVDELASTDPVAGNILDKAAAHLSEAVFAGARRVGLGNGAPPRVCAVGRSFRSERLIRTFTEYLTLQWPEFSLAEPRGYALDGAAALVTLAPDSLLAPRVSRIVR